DLRPGDLLTTPDATVVLDGVRTETVDETDAVTVYNIHVHTHHTYYVLAGDVPVLVHNAAGHGAHPRLTAQPDGTFLSHSGLRYGHDPSPNFATRVDHVLNHANDIPARPMHGVFDGDAISLTDEAWDAVKSGRGFAVQQGNKTVYHVNMGRPVGFIGGQVGAAAGNPAVGVIRLVTQGDSVITSFPVAGIPM
ncbi:hypothetical protein ACFT5B_19025, partial [Luteimicrobium sp. NPDC057192]|uniref:hypothetical protein n=1 Tax=Luteimicrobium sp. NPDC057192 TaxID=3346042 RepID=UPI00362A8F62